MPLEPRSKRYYALTLWVHRFLLRLEQKVALFIAPSDFMRELMIEAGLPAEKVIVVRNFSRETPRAAPSVGKFGLFLGRLSPEKGIHVLLRAIHAAGSSIPFRIIGDGPERTSLEGLAAELQLNNVRFFGRLPRAEALSHLQEAEFVVMPSVSFDNAPLAVLEALGAARPVIVSDAGGLPEMVTAQSGMVFRSGNHKELASGMRALHDAPELRLRMGQASASEHRRRFSPQVHLAALNDCYEQVFGANGGPV